MRHHTAHCAVLATPTNMDMLPQVKSLVRTQHLFVFLVNGVCQAYYTPNSQIVVLFP